MGYGMGLSQVDISFACNVSFPGIPAILQHWHSHLSAFLSAFPLIGTHTLSIPVGIPTLYLSTTN